MSEKDGPCDLGIISPGVGPSHDQEESDPAWVQVVLVEQPDQLTQVNAQLLFELVVGKACSQPPDHPGTNRPARPARRPLEHQHPATTPISGSQASIQGSRTQLFMPTGPGDH